LHVSGTTQPTGANFVEMAAQDHATLPAPCLVVDYVVPPPTVTPTASVTGTATASVAATSPTATLTADSTATVTITTLASPTPTPDPVPQQQQFCEQTSADDGRLNRTDVAYPPGGVVTVNTGGTFTDARRSRRPAGDYSVGVALLRFDTAALPDTAVVLAAQLDVYVNGLADSDGRSIVCEFYDGANWPIDAADYTDSEPTQRACDAPLATIPGAQVATIALDTALADQWLSRTAATGLRLHIADGPTPSGPNYLELATQDHASLPAPCLVVDYIVP
jgi:hypothetical protein